MPTMTDFSDSRLSDRKDRLPHPSAALPQMASVRAEPAPFVRAGEITISVSDDRPGSATVRPAAS